jgi:hypothetical protein
VKVNKAVDNNDQKLSAVEAQAGPNNPFPQGGAVIGGPGRAWVMIGNWGMGGTSNFVPVKFKKGEKETKSLKELSGTIAGLVLGKAEEMLVVDKLMKAVGKTVKGKKNGELKINKVDKANDGTITIEFEMEMPSNVVPETMVDIPIPAGAFPNARPPVKVPLPIAPPAKKEAPVKSDKVKVEAKQAPAAKPVAGGGIIVRIQPGGGFAGGGVMPLAMRYAINGLTLQDDKGKPLYATISFNWKKGGVIAPGGQGKQNYVATYRPVKGLPAEPSKLVFTGRKEVAVNVPFTLKNVNVK